MSNRELPILKGVKVEGSKKMSSGANGRQNEFVYVNSAFSDSVNNVNMNERNRNSVAPVAPITEVYREQYWACSRWPYTQRILAIAVGVLLGALIGLTIPILLRKINPDVHGPTIFRQHVAPD